MDKNRGAACDREFKKNERWINQQNGDVQLNGDRDRKHQRERQTERMSIYVRVETRKYKSMLNIWGIFVNTEQNWQNNS